jgi:aspartate aminotransferase-like enzyme
MHSEDILMCPGPNDMSDRVIRAMMRPAAAPASEEFQELYEQTLDMLARIYQTTKEVVPIPGSGRSGLEAAITSVVEPGDRTLTIANGHFGGVAMQIIGGVGGRPEAFEEPWGSVIDMDAFAAKLADGPYKLVTLVHNETSSGAVYQSEQIARLAHEHGALFLLDAVSSLAGAELRTDDWDIDLAVSCNHKAIGAPIGHAHVVVGERAWDTMDARSTPCGSVFGNLKTWKSQVVPSSSNGRAKKRAYGVFPAVHLFYAMHEAFTSVLEEGLESRFERHLLNAEAFREGITGLGLKPLAHPDVASPTVTCVHLPEGITSNEFLYHFRHDHGLFTLPGLGEFADTAVRIGHMGVTATPRNILHTLHAFDNILYRLGHLHDRGAGIARAEEIYQAAEQAAPVTV